MLFNSTEFLVFFAFFCGAYFLASRTLFLRNLIIAAASYVFYGCWDYRFTVLLLFTSFTDFLLAIGIGALTNPLHRRALLVSSLVVNIGALAFFKYSNFFLDSASGLLNALGFDVHWQGLSILLPIGISFYTFQSMGYVVDVYRRQMPPCRNLVQFLAYVSFFPQLVAGPIERAAHLLPQFASASVITRADLESGAWLIIWGLFKKVFIADNLAPLVQLVFHEPPQSMPAFLLGTIAFSIRIYGDFSGYSDIARGLARWLGFDLMRNFNRPYFATSLRDFWSRWHISLSTWVRDYIYFPLGGSRHGEARTQLNLLVAMLVCGLWHGAALNFVLWGLWHALGLMVNHCWIRHRPAAWAFPAWLGWCTTMFCVLFGWLLFRAESFDQIYFLGTAIRDWSVPLWWKTYVVDLLLLATPLFAVEFWQSRRGALDALPVNALLPRAALQGALVLLVIACWESVAAPFIYFQF